MTNDMTEMKRRTLEERMKLAREKFSGGYNCAQSVLTSFSDLLEQDEQDLKRIASGFGGGMGKLQMTCGAVTGSFMVFGQYASMHTSSDAEAKDLAERMIRGFEKEYVAANGSLTCRTILGVDLNTDAGLRVAREKDLFGTVCVDAVVSAVKLTDRIINKSEAQGHLL